MLSKFAYHPRELSPKKRTQLEKRWAAIHVAIVKNTKTREPEHSKQAARLLGRVEKLATELGISKPPYLRLAGSLSRLAATQKGPFTFRGIRPRIERFGPDNAMRMLQEAKAKGMARTYVAKNARGLDVQYWQITHKDAFKPTPMGYLACLLEAAEEALGITRMPGGEVVSAISGLNFWGDGPDMACLRIPPKALTSTPRTKILAKSSPIPK
jgi:hypothetical protein